MAARTLVGFALDAAVWFSGSMFCKPGRMGLRGRIFVPGVPACVPEDGKDAEREHTMSGFAGTKREYHIDNNRK